MRAAGDERGFSLVELLIVIGMLGALTGVVMFSLQAFDGGVRTAADEIETVDLAVGCDAGHGDLLVVAGCSGPAIPAGPPLPDLSGTVEITSTDPEPSTASEPLTVRIQVTDARGEPLVGAFVRVEVHDGPDATGPLLASAAAPSTDASGATGHVTSRDSAGALTLVACIGTNDAPPDDCASAPGGVSEPFTRVFQVRPRLVFWDRATNASLVAIWDVDVSETVSPAANYLIYASAQACADGVAPLASGTARAVATGSGGTTLQLDLSGNALPQGQMASRRLQILGDTEHTPAAAGGLGNRRTPCLPFGNVPEAQTISVSSANGNSPIGNPVAHTVTVVDDQGRPFTGASVRYEITSDVGSPTLAGSPGALTDGNGQTVFGYTRRAGGTDTIRVCTQANGGLPTSCAAATGPQTTSTRTWVTAGSPVAAPKVVAWNRVGNDTIQVTWNTDVDRSPAPPADDYGIFATPTDCAAGSPVAATGTSRTIVPGTGGSTVRVTFPANVVKQRGMADRRLTVGAEAETNTAGTGNAAVDCLAPTTVPVPATLLLDPPSGDSPAGAESTLTASLAASDGAPFAGAQLLFQVSGAEPVADQTAATDSSGAAAFTYSRAIDSDDDLVVCTNADGSLPVSCLSATGPSGTATRTWFTTPPTPTVASWSRVSNAAIEVTWNTDVRDTAADAAGYRMFDAGGACPAGTPLNGGAGETREVVSGTDGRTVLITFARNVTQSNFLDDRRLQVVAGTEANIDGVGNPASDCLAAS